MFKKIVAGIIVFTSILPMSAMAQTLSARTSFETAGISSIRTTENEQTSSIRTAGLSWFSISSIRISD